MNGMQVKKVLYRMQNVTLQEELTQVQTLIGINSLLI